MSTGGGGVGEERVGRGRPRSSAASREGDSRRTYHPEYIAAARDLCARYLEEVQAGRLLPEAQASGGSGGSGGGRYDVTRQIGEPGQGGFTTENAESAEGIKLLDAA